jgi:hypothetical protein
MVRAIRFCRHHVRIVFIFVPPLQAYLAHAKATGVFAIMSVFNQYRTATGQYRRARSGRSAEEGQPHGNKATARRLSDLSSRVWQPHNRGSLSDLPWGTESADRDGEGGHASPV